MLYNDTLEYEVTTDLSEEPVTLTELKQHLNMAFDTLGSYTFTDDDTYLNRLIKASRQFLEKYTGLSFGEKTITAFLDNNRGGIEIPFGPVRSITSIKDYYGEVIASDAYTLRGSKYKKIVSPSYDYMEVTYTAGLTVVPEDLKQAILCMCAALYKYRGDQTEAESGKWWMMALELASPYKRTSFLA